MLSGRVHTVSCRPITIQTACFGRSALKQQKTTSIIAYECSLTMYVHVPVVLIHPKASGGTRPLETLHDKTIYNVNLEILYML